MINKGALENKMLRLKGEQRMVKYKNKKEGKEDSVYPMDHTHTDLELKPLPPETADLTAKVIGDFGLWQFRIGFLMALLKLPIAWYQLNIIFMAPPQTFWCLKPEFLTGFSENEWRKICYPMIEEHPCLVYDPEFLHIWPDMDRRQIPMVACKHFTYDTSVFNRTIISDWDLVCSKHWIVHLTQCIMMWGVLLGSIFFGIAADKYGRKTPLMAGILIQTLFSYIVAFMHHYWWFLINWFIMALASGGIGIISFVICMEAVSGKWRTIIPVLYQLPFGLGTAVMAGLAYWFRDWRKLELALASLSGLCLLYWLVIPESPRWLLATGQTDKALEVLKNAAKLNNRDFNTTDVKTLLHEAENHVKPKSPAFRMFFRSKNMRLKTMLLSINWFCTGLSFFMISQYLGSIGSNIFLAVAVTGIISTFGGLLCILIITRAGRKTTILVFQLIIAICFIFLLVIPKDMVANDWPRLLCAGIGFAGMAGSIPALYLYSGELFPTLGRNVGISGVTMFARVASMMAPAVISLESWIADLPVIILAIMSFAQMFLVVPLPETKGLALPDSLEQAEQI